ncbi:hypothetical protein AURDEDRAFT_159792 [Auricularia subglabra TFB-10046 SS5]|nr:hypothetical protein AURDEDRAFT_159792 [Auricularia subglabra TFB-10046 SS5]
MDAAAVAAAVPPEVIEAYICETFPAPMHVLIRSQPAGSWVQPERLGGTSMLKNIEEVYVLTEIPECWPVPRVNTAYMLDLRGAQTSYNKDDGTALSMDAIIKRHDQDSWGGGSGGSRNPAKQTSVALLGGIKCMQSTRTCNGLYVCSEFDPAHLQDYRRFEPDWEKTSDIFSASQKLNENEVVVIAANQPHSHPSFPSYKLSYAAKAKVEKAIRAMGSLATSVQTLRNAPITAEITGTRSLGELHGALDQDRTVRLLIQKDRKSITPLGTGLTAVFDCMRKQRESLPAGDVYIHEVSDNGIPIIICMLSRVVREIHSARSIVVDMTYKTIAGDFKLWHVVMFSSKYNRRMIHPDCIDKH